jgi:hypothetical protein
MATSSNSHPSYFEKVTGRPVSALWVMRVFAISVVTVLVLAMFVFKTGNPHDFCLGIAVGLMVGLLAQSFAISKVELKDAPSRSDVDNISFVP